MRSPFASLLTGDVSDDDVNFISEAILSGDVSDDELSLAAAALGDYEDDYAEYLGVGDFKTTMARKLASKSGHTSRRPVSGVVAAKPKAAAAKLRDALSASKAPARVDLISVKNGSLMQSDLPRGSSVALGVMQATFAMAFAATPFPDVTGSQSGAGITSTATLIAAAVAGDDIIWCPMLILEISQGVGANSPGRRISFNVNLSHNATASGSSRITGDASASLGWASGLIDVRLGNPNEPTVIAMIPWKLVGSDPFPMLVRRGHDGTNAFGTVALTAWTGPTTDAALMTLSATLPGPRNPVIQSLMNI